MPRVGVDEAVRAVDDLAGAPWTLHVNGDCAAEDVGAAAASLVGFDGRPAQVSGDPVRHGRPRALGRPRREARRARGPRRTARPRLPRLREPANLTWLLGARVNVPQILDAACLDVVVRRDGTAGAPSVTVVTNAIEAPRLRDVELAGLDEACRVDWDVVRWWEGRATGSPPANGSAATPCPRRGR